jgi:hypothetical protein
MLELEELMKILRVQARADETYRYANFPFLDESHCQCLEIDVASDLFT